MESHRLHHGHQAALATVQETTEPHLRRQACSARFRNKAFSPRARALASWDKKFRPPTSTARTTNLSSTAHQFRVRAQPSSSAAWGYRLCGGRTQEWCRWQAELRRRGGAHQQPPPTSDRQSHVEDAQHHVGRDPAARLAEHPGNLSKVHPRLPNTPACAHAARWWPQESSCWPHRQERTVKGRSSRRWRRKCTRNN